MRFVGAILRHERAPVKWSLLPEHRTIHAVDHSGDELVTIDRFLYVGDAELARALLEASGVDAVLADENIVRMAWGDAQAHGGVRLQVRRSDAAEAMEILRDEQVRGVEIEDHRDYAAPRSETCRRCGSEEVFPAESRAKAYTRAIVIMIAGFVFADLASLGSRVAGIHPPRQLFAAILLASVLSPFVVVITTAVVPRKRCRNCNAAWRGTQV
jgi:hypothetical protein